MDLWDFKKWRRKLKYSQFEAAEALGFKRSGVQNWESERVPISEVVELACEELTLRWKQRPEFGPVTLIYADEQVWPGPDQAARRLFVQCELYANNEAALQRASRLKKTRNFISPFINPFIAAEDGEIVWASPELLRECDRRSEEEKGVNDVSDAAPDPNADRSGN